MHGIEMMAWHVQWYKKKTIQLVFLKVIKIN